MVEAETLNTSESVTSYPCITDGGKLNSEPQSKNDAANITDPKDAQINNLPIACPECGSSKLYRNGLLYLPDDSSIQRWLCRDCSCRFNEKPLKENSKWSINTQANLVSRRQICATTQYHKKPDVFYISKLLGHKSVLTTQVYVNMEKMAFVESSNEYIVKVASTLDEACKLSEVGFEYVTENEGHKLFKKRK
jgi:transposase-like protein